MHGVDLKGSLAHLLSALFSNHCTLACYNHLASICILMRITINTFTCIIFDCFYLINTCTTFITAQIKSADLSAGHSALFSIGWEKDRAVQNLAIWT